MHQHDDDDVDDVFHNSPQRRAVAFIASLLMSHGDLPMSAFDSPHEWGEPRSFQRMRKNINDIWKKVTGRVLFYEVNARGEKATRGSDRRFRLNHASHLGVTADTPAYIAAASSLIKPMIEGTILGEYSAKFQNQIRKNLSAQERNRFDNIQKKFHFMYRAPIRIERNREVFNTIVQAVISQQAVQIEYNLGQKTATVRPLSIMISNECFYLVGYRWHDEDLSEQRHWRIDKIISANLLSDKTFKYPKAYTPKAFGKQSFGFLSPQHTKSIRVSLHVVDQSSAYDYLSHRRLSSHDQWIKRPDGDWSFSFDAANEDEPMRLILSMGRDVQVILPTSLREKVTKELRDTLQSYHSVQAA